MKEIFDWLREQVYGNNDKAKNFSKDTHVVNKEYIDNIITEAEAKWEATEAEIRAKAIEEFAKAIMAKATEESEKVVFDGRLVGYALSLDCVSDVVAEVTEKMRKGE